MNRPPIMLSHTHNLIRNTYPRMMLSVLCFELALGILLGICLITTPCIATESVKIFGHVMNTGGEPVIAWVGLHDENWNFMQGVETDSAGYYAMSVDRRSAYNFWVDSWAQNGDYRVEAYIPEVRTIEAESDKDFITVDFTLRPAGNIIMRFYDSNGNLLRNSSFRNLVQSNCSITALDDLPVDGVLNVAFDEESNGDWEKALPASIIPLNQPVEIHMPYELPGFGKIAVTADNEGEGYTINRQSNYKEINLNYEIAKSELSELQKDYDELTSQGYDLPSIIYEQIQSARQYLEEAEAYLFSGSSDIKNIVRILNNSLKETLIGLRALSDEEVQININKWRKGSIKITVVNTQGDPVTGCKIRYKQVSHDFLFGVGMTCPNGPYPVSLFEQLMGIGTNVALPWMSWGHIEPHPGQFDWNFADYNYHPFQLSSLGYNLIAHCFLWFYDDYGNVPGYLKNIDFSLLEDMTYKHVLESVKHYRDVIKWWTISEPIMSNALGLSKSEWLDLSKVFVKAVRDVSPEAKIELVLYPAKMDDRGYDPEDVVESFVEAGVDFDIIGIELYPFCLPLDEHGYPDLEYFTSYLDGFSRFGKPIFLHEVGVPNTPSLEVQAQFIHDLYSMAFSKPYILGIVWYFITDDNSFLPGAGLFEDDLTPRSAYWELKNLISTWTSSGTTTTDANGGCSIEGFAGEYEIVVEYPDGAKAYHVHIYERKAMSCRISPNSLEPEPTLDLKANYSDGPLTLNPSDMLSVSGSLETNGRNDLADWWLAAFTPVGLFFYSSEGWRAEQRPIYQGRLFDTGDFRVLEIPAEELPVGMYHFYFGIDDHMDGEISPEYLFYDVVTVQIEGE